MAERVININGVYYVSRTNENGIYMERVNADGSPWVDSRPALTEAEKASGISIGPVAPVAPSRVLVAPAPSRSYVPQGPRRSWWRRLFG